MNNIKELEPKEVFQWFYELNQIPRSSGNEKEVSDFLVKFAKDRNLEVYQDEALNVIIKKPGTKGYENSPAVILQGHMDMVCVKTDDSDHDFDKDPIEMIVEGDIMRANNTTLGGDDGIAVAYGLAILDADDIPHPPIELLITTCEEDGMEGATALTGEHLTGTRLLNIDTEEEGEFLLGCSGGSNIDMTFPIAKEAVSGKACKIELTGLKGGHSGSEINKQRLNAIKGLARILNAVKDDVLLASIEGGIKHNAIPSKASAVIVTDNMEKVTEKINAIVADIKDEYRVEDPGLTVNLTEVEAKEAYTKELSMNIIEFLMTLPDGVQYMSKDIEGLVQTSLNNAIIGEKDGNILLITSVRSGSTSSLREILDRLNILTKRFGGSAREYSAYPAWPFEAESELRDIATKTFVEQYGKEPIANSIHAGLECGLLKGILPNTDMLSYGPNIRDAHSPKEHMSISSVQRVWEFTKNLLANLK
ncbi:aminoacyl-histidine dipeptidase [Peptostreptococcus russellii]|uniref:Cytosol non-specific dipeptidase n=1 Tax=Peptostreptococcus russellii TaxID=215200 RepID=A0A1H8HRE6_9FIRM|nr:aminoacyl-histidine dipeptidase [Peptostreptococcus russellii]SEN58653.1 dipeptidase D [Peptostreptococcus russellii]